MVRGDSMEICVIFLLMVLATTEAVEHRSVAECNVKTGMVYYDPIGKVCRCDRRQCYIRANPPGEDVKEEEECIRLPKICGIGMEPDPTKTTCVRCKKGTFKSEEGCEWCKPLTVCRDTERTDTVFTGNYTTDTECSSLKLKENSSPTPQLQNISELISTVGANTADTTTKTLKDAFVGSATAKGGISSDLLSDELLYGFFILCGGIFLAFVVFAGCYNVFCKSSAPATTENHDEDSGENEKLIDRMVPDVRNQTCIYQEEGAMQRSAEQTRLQGDDETSCKTTMTSNLTVNTNDSLARDDSTPHLSFSLLDDTLKHVTSERLMPDERRRPFVPLVTCYNAGYEENSMCRLALVNQSKDVCNELYKTRMIQFTKSCRQTAPPYTKGRYGMTSFALASSESDKDRFP